MDSNKLRRLAGLPMLVESKVITEGFGDALEKYMELETIHRFEGRTGLINFAKICRAIGYKDPNYYGQLSQDASVGDIINFLEDNSGAFDAMLEFIERHGSHDWETNLRDTMAELGHDDEEE